LPPGDQSQPSDERIAARNAIALAYIKPAAIDLDDLNSLMSGHPEYHSDNVHFNEQGIALQAAQVATNIEKMLKP
jgi:lysophospholipase L1-like esterase